MDFFPLIDYKSFEMALDFEFKKYLQLVVGRGKISSYKQIVTKIQEIVFDALPFTIIAAEGVRKAKFTKLHTFGFCLWPKA